MQRPLKPYGLGSKQPWDLKLGNTQTLIGIWTTLLASRDDTRDAIEAVGVEPGPRFVAGSSERARAPVTPQD